MKRKMKTKTKKRLMQAGGITVSFVPMLTEIAIHHEVYFATKEASWAMTIGGIIAVALVALAMLGKIGKLFGSEIRVIGTIFAMSCLLKPILLNFQWLSGLLFAGMLTNRFTFHPKIKQLEKQIKYEEQAQVVKETLNNG